MADTSSGVVADSKVLDYTSSGYTIAVLSSHIFFMAQSSTLIIGVSYSKSWPEFTPKWYLWWAVSFSLFTGGEMSDGSWFLTHSMLGKKFSRWDFEVFFLFYFPIQQELTFYSNYLLRRKPENKSWHFDANCFLRTFSVYNLCFWRLRFLDLLSR